jgi:hypothetical protein
MIPCWRSELESIILGTLYDGLNHQPQVAFEDLLQFLQEYTPLPQALSDDGVPLDAALLRDWAARFPDTFECDASHYWLKHRDEESGSQSEPEQEYSLTEFLQSQQSLPEQAQESNHSELPFPFDE